MPTTRKIIVSILPTTVFELGAECSQLRKAIMITLLTTQRQLSAKCLRLQCWVDVRANIATSSNSGHRWWRSARIQSKSSIPIWPTLVDFGTISVEHWSHLVDHGQHLGDIGQIRLTHRTQFGRFRARRSWNGEHVAHMCLRIVGILQSAPFHL